MGPLQVGHLLLLTVVRLLLPWVEYHRESRHLPHRESWKVVFLELVVAGAWGAGQAPSPLLMKKMLILFLQKMVMLFLVDLVEMVRFRLSNWQCLVELPVVVVVTCIRHCSQQTRPVLEDLF